MSSTQSGDTDKQRLEPNDPASNTTGLGVRVSPEPCEIFRQVFALSMASNALYTSNGTQDALLECMQTNLPRIVSAIGGQWTVVWGPVVWKDQPDVEDGPDNTWFIAHSPSVPFDDGSIREAYVVAIAGTNSNSDYGWTENLSVGRVVDFPAWVANGIIEQPVPVNQKDIAPFKTYVANGTAGAVHTLLTERSPPGSASAGLTLYEYLTGIPASESTRVVFTGHSLGGTLAPTLALALVRSGGLKGKAMVYPTAGVSPGNRGFANLFAETFPASSSTCPETEYAVWNTNIINSLDIVPQAWCTKRILSPAQNMKNIPSIYGVPAVRLIEIFAFALRAIANSSGTVYIPLRSRIIPGVSEATPGDVEGFLGLAMKNHNAFYSDLFGVELPELEGCDGLTKKTKEEMLLEYPVIGDIEWEREHPGEMEAAVSALQASEGALDDEEEEE
ncbi:hypothetical protein DFH29DRAFT_1077741 [Suillus ampliporus]|nr:hypothetical protein DFH29DRAFT_1077741 [Suillus ampliporus]